VAIVGGREREDRVLHSPSRPSFSYTREGEASRPRRPSLSRSPRTPIYPQSFPSGILKIKQGEGEQLEGEGGCS
jgi:hypothetical protein